MQVLSIFFNGLEPLFRLAQRWLGPSRLGWLFVAPNLIVFGLFTFLPILINLVYATTGGVNLMPLQRPYTGAENFEILFDCRDYFDLVTCRKDIFWRAMFNTVKFSVLQVGLMVGFSLLTALVLNRKIIGRGFWRGGCDNSHASRRNGIFNGAHAARLSNRQQRLLRCAALGPSPI